MSDYKYYFDWSVYGLLKSEKDELLAKVLTDLTARHAANCDAYKAILMAHHFD